MARVVDQKYATLIGTRDGLRAYLEEIMRTGAGVIDLKFSNVLVLDTQPSDAVVLKALHLTPKRQR